MVLFKIYVSQLKLYALLILHYSEKIIDQSLLRAKSNISCKCHLSLMSVSGEKEALSTCFNI